MSRQQNGWATVGQALGTLFGGGQARDEAVFKHHLEQTADINRKLALADSARMIALEEHALRNDPTLTPTQRAAVVAGRGADLHNVFRAGGEQQRQRFRQDVFDAAAAGDLDRANALLFGLATGPVDRVDVHDGVAIDRHDFGNLGNHFVLPTGQARINQLQAQAQASQASAELRNRQMTHPQEFRSQRQAEEDFNTTDDAIQAATFNQWVDANPDLGLARVAIPVPGTPKRPSAAAAPAAQLDLPPPHINPRTGEIFDYDPQSHQWVLRPAQGAPRP